MGWAVGYANGRDIGYGVPCECEHPGCTKRIDRGLAYVCGGGDADGCGLYFCYAHGGGVLCERCESPDEHGNVTPFEMKSDLPEWTHHKETDPSWAEWRAERAARKGA